MERKFGLSSTALRFLAMFFMLLDHMWATVVSGYNIMTYIGRMALPIFAFLIAEGYAHTSNVRNYKRRLLIFGILSEIPFNLVVSGSCFFIFHQNVMFTLLFGIYAIEAIERIKKDHSVKSITKNLLILGAVFLLSLVTFVDYNVIGVATVVLFYLCRGIRFSWLFQVLGLFCLNIWWHKGMLLAVTIGSFSFEFPTQGFALFSLIFIWLYNGKKGYSNKVVQYFAYAFYPLHMLVLYLIWLVM